jgi:hypothetical protein
MNMPLRFKEAFYQLLILHRMEDALGEGPAGRSPSHIAVGMYWELNN